MVPVGTTRGANRDRSADPPRVRDLDGSAAASVSSLRGAESRSPWERQRVQHDGSRVPSASVARPPNPLPRRHKASRASGCATARAGDGLPRRLPSPSEPRTCAGVAATTARRGRRGWAGPRRTGCHGQSPGQHSEERGREQHSPREPGNALRRGARTVLGRKVERSGSCRVNLAHPPGAPRSATK
jgi:hypothetical protein